MAPINLTSKVARFKSKRKVLLPRPLKEKLDSCNLTRLQREKATRFLWLIIKESTRSKKRNLSSFIPRPRNYMREVFNSRYAEWLQVLKNDILEVKGFIDDDGTIIESYSIDKYSKSYRIRAELLSTEWVESSYTEEASENCETLRIAEEVVRKSIVYDDLRQLLINEEKLKAVTEEYAASITANHFRIDDQISTCYIRHVVDNCTGYEGPSSVSESLKRAKEMGVNLIQDGDSFFIDDINDYIIRKKRNVRVSYYHSIKALVEGWFYANRNGTNRRLDHNLTALPSLL